MARRIDLPRLTRRQRLAKWQRERRQQAIYLGVFTGVLLFAFGLVGWAAASSYYDQNLRPVARIEGTSILMRDVNERWLFEKVLFYEEFGIRRELERDPEVAAYANTLRSGALENVLLREVLLRVAREEGTLPSEAEVRAQVERDFGELHVRHILIPFTDDAVDFTEEGTETDGDAEGDANGEGGEGTNGEGDGDAQEGEPAEPVDPEEAEARALAKARELAAELRADPRNDQLWGRLAAEHSRDEGSRFSGGDLGRVSARSGFVPEFEEAMFGLADGEVSDPVRSQFGYHIIQRISSRHYTETALYLRLRAVGFTDAALMRVAEGQLLHERYDRQALEQEIESPQPQLHLARIVITLGSPLNFEQYTFQLRRVEEVREGIRENEPFEDLARRYSDDTATALVGGDMGWVTRDMIFDRDARGMWDDLWTLSVGEVSRQHVVERATRVVFFKVLDRYEYRELDEEQRQRLRANAFDRWLFEQEQRFGLVRLRAQL